MPIADWPQKHDFLRRLAAQMTSLDEEAAFFRFYWPQIDNNKLRSVQNRIDQWGTASMRQGAGLEFLNHVTSKIQFQGDIGDFSALPYESWVSRVPQKFHANSETSVREERVCMFIDPTHHPLSPEEEWQRKRIVDQRFMYISRLSVLDWNNLIEDGRYGTYNLCEKTLHLTLDSGIFSDIKTVVILGAGSYSKDKLIIEEISSTNPEQRLRIILVDASFYMLLETYERLRKFVKRSSVNCDLEMHCFDFTDAEVWTKNICSRESQDMAVFLLGGTIGNLREAEFFDVIRDALPQGSLLIVAGEFFESREAIENARAGLLERYRQDAAKDLSLTAINDLLNREPAVRSLAQRRDFVEVDIKPANLLPADLHSDVPDTQSVFFRTKGKIHSLGQTFDQLYLVTSKRYVKQRFIDWVAVACALDHLRTVDLPGGEVFSHLIFRKRHSP